MGHSAQSEFTEWANATLYSTSTATQFNLWCCWPPSVSSLAWGESLGHLYLSVQHSLQPFSSCFFFQHAQEGGEGRAEANDALTQNVLWDQAPRLAASDYNSDGWTSEGIAEIVLVEQKRTLGDVSSMWTVKEVSLLGRPWVCRWRTGRVVVAACVGRATEKALNWQFFFDMKWLFQVFEVGFWSWLSSSIHFAIK